MIEDKEIIKLLRALHLALHAMEDGMKEEANISDKVDIKVIKNENTK